MDDERDAVLLTSKVILVTGAAQGLGRATALLAARLGAAAVVVCDRNGEAGRAVARELEATGCEGLFIECDVTHPDQIEAAVRTTDERFGRIDGLANCVGDTSRGKLETTDVELWDRVQHTNLRCHFLFTQAVSRVMRRCRTRGSIVNIASVQAHGGITDCMAYAVAKAGLVCLTKNNAAELGRYGIKVNAINMGWCVTDNEHVLQSSLAGNDWVAAADSTCALGRILRPKDVARLVAFLLADASHVTGSAIDWHPEYVLGMLSGAVGRAQDVPAPSK